MPLTHVIELMGLSDLSFTPTGGSPVDIYGARKMTIEYDGVDKSAEGDDKTLAHISIIKGAKISFEAMSIDLDALAALSGQTVTDSGVTPNQTAKLQIKTGKTPVGKLIGKGKIIQGSGTLPKVMEFEIPYFSVNAGELKINLAFEDLATFSCGGYAVSDSNDIAVEITAKET